MLESALESADGIILSIAYGITRFADRFINDNFRSALPRKASLFVFPGEESGNAANSSTSSVISHDELGRWLEELPKPAAVFGANDLFASEVITVCERLGLKVPQQVSVIGCDNAPLIFANTHPALTSLQLPFRELGYRAAATLGMLLKGRKPPRDTVRVSGTKLFERGSSAAVPPATLLVERAREYIAAHACSGIRTNDVIVYCGVSRSLLDLRFRQIAGKSILEEILDVRLSEVKRLLGETDRRIGQIGHDCGFNDPDNLKRLFRKRFGMSMRDYRNSQIPI